MLAGEYFLQLHFTGLTGSDSTFSGALMPTRQLARTPAIKRRERVREREKERERERESKHSNYASK